MSKVVTKTEPKAAAHGRATKRSAVVTPDWTGKFSRLGGSTSDDWNNVLADQAIGSLWLGNADDPQRSPESRGQQANAAYAFLMRMQVSDELEAMMTAQLFASHNAAMECYRRAMIPQQSMQGRSENLSQANKLSRTFATVTEALARHRGKSTQQKVTVKHVHVHEGGQAAFGQFNAPPAGGGVRTKVEDQSHEKPDADAPEPPLLCADPLRNVLPISSDAERTMPAARRRQSRRAQG